MFGALFAWAINTKTHKVQFPADYRLPFMVLALCILVILVISIFLPVSINKAKQISSSDVSEDDDGVFEENNKMKTKKNRKSKKLRTWIFLIKFKNSYFCIYVLCCCCCCYCGWRCGCYWLLFLFLFWGNIINDAIRIAWRNASRTLVSTGDLT